MANEEHVALLKQGVEVWNEWREESPDVRPDLFKSDLSRVNLTRANLGWTNLCKADLSEADLTAADLTGTNLLETNLFGANLCRANLLGANMTGTNLGGANLGGANLTAAHLFRANLNGTNLIQANLCETIFSDNDLTNVEALDKCVHGCPSIVDHRTLQRSGSLPLLFLRGVGLPDKMIDYLPSILLEQPIQFFSCFISYSSKDQKFADRLHADLQNKGVRCWFAPHDLPIGAKTWDTIDEAIRLRDKVLLILSKNAIGSDWVEDEVTKAFAEERTRNQLVLFPIRLDDAVMKTGEAWAGKLRDNRNIGDFRRWKNHDAYEKALERVLRDLRMAPVEG